MTDWHSGHALFEVHQTLGYAGLVGNSQDDPNSRALLPCSIPWCP
jgi:hypothetical protein